MPVNNHLSAIEITDFAPGLWEASSHLMPPTAAQTMLNCHPQPGGGLRAFYKGTGMTTTGIANPTQERVLGLYARGSLDVRAGVGLGQEVDYYLMTYRYASGATRPMLYRMDGTNGETSWTRIYRASGTNELTAASSDNNAPQKATFRYFRLLTGAPNDNYVVVSLVYLTAYDGTGRGLYRMNYNDLSSAQKMINLSTSISGDTYPSGALTVHQSRLIVSGLSDQQALLFTDPGTVTFSAANYLRVEPSADLSAIIAMHPNAPSDLLLLKEGAPMVAVQGDITDPVVQSMVEGIAAGTSGLQDFGRTPYGLTYISTGGGIYMTNGSTVTPLSEQLGPFSQQADFVGPGDTNFLNGYLFAPNGYVYDFETKAWFKQDRMAGALHNVERSTRQIWGSVATGVSFALRSISPFPGQQRNDTYTWKSAPFRDPSGRELEVREVEIMTKAYASGGSFTVTIGGVSRTVNLGASGVQGCRALFAVRGDALDITITANSGNSSVEAPSIEAVRVYTRAGHHRW